MSEEEKQYSGKDPVSFEVVRIEKRKRDGIRLYQYTQASLRLNRLANNIDHITYNEYVYTPMEKVINQINGGNFLDAHVELFTIASNAYLSDAMLLSFKNTIANYILYEGDYVEFVGKTLDATTGIIS